jgi:hypothetical protein
LFDSLVEPVRTLEMLRRSWPFPGEFLDTLTTKRDSLWLQLRVLVISAKYGPASALALEEAELSGDDRKEAAAAAKVCNQDQIKGSGGSKKKTRRRRATTVVAVVIWQRIVRPLARWGRVLLVSKNVKLRW